MSDRTETNCPYLLDNPGCPFLSVITENRTDIKWIKKRLESKLEYVRMGVDVTAIISIIVLILRISGAF